MPNMLKSAKTGKFHRISRVPENFEKVPENFWNWIFWVQNQLQWLKLSGKNAQNDETDQKQQIQEKGLQN